ncbi:hypothetical protein D3C76_1089150 [compost metagenome]
MLADPARDFRTAGIGEARQLAVVGDRHDARHDRDVHAQCPHAFHEVEVAVGVEEVLGDRTVGASVGLAHEVGHIVFEIARLRMHFRVSGDFDVEMITGFFTNEFNQVIGVAQLTAGHAHARRQVTAQGDDTLDAGSLVLGQQAAQVVLAIAHAGQVRSGRDFDFAFELQHGVQRAITGRTAGAVGAGEEIGVVRGQLTGSGEQLFMPSIGLRREELEAVATILGHGHILGNS